MSMVVSHNLRSATKNFILYNIIKFSCIYPFHSCYNCVFFSYDNGIFFYIIFISIGIMSFSEDFKDKSHILVYLKKFKFIHLITTNSRFLQ